jgi:hypothetical protein
MISIQTRKQNLAGAITKLINVLGKKDNLVDNLGGSILLMHHIIL